MSDPYKAAYLREREARLQAERLLEDKTRALYDKVKEMENTLDNLRTVQAQLVQSEKMASIGLLSAGVAHEINNPIGFSIANLATLKEYLPPLFELDNWVCSALSETPALLQAYKQQAVAADLDYIKEDANSLISDTLAGLNRVKDIVASLKKISHNGDGEAQQCDVNECIEDALKVVWNELKYNMQVFKQLNAVPRVNALAAEFQQVLINMFINAAQACEDNGELRICSSVKLVDRQPLVEVCICDNGKGMDKTVMKRIFDPFFTTKPMGVGSGLGLSISNGIIEKYHGQLLVSSTPGEGTRFTIRLPVAEPEQEDIPLQCANCELPCSKLEPAN